MSSSGCSWGLLELGRVFFWGKHTGKARCIRSKGKGKCHNVVDFFLTLGQKRRLFCGRIPKSSHQPDKMEANTGNKGGQATINFDWEVGSHQSRNGWQGREPTYEVGCFKCGRDRGWSTR